MSSLRWWSGLIAPASQVEEKAAFLSLVIPVLGGSAYELEAGSIGSGFPKPNIGTVFQHPEKLALGVEVERVNLIQEQNSAVGVSYASGGGLICPGKRA